MGGRRSGGGSVVFSTMPRLVGWVLALLIVSILGVMLWSNDERYRAQLVAVEESDEIHRSINDVLSSLKDAETSQRGFVLTANEEFLEPYSQGRLEVPRRLAVLQQLVAGDPAQRRSLGELMRLVRAKFAEMDASIQLRREGREGDALALVQNGKGRQFMLALQRETEQMLSLEQRRLSERSLELEERRRELVVILGGTWLFVGLVVISGLWSSARGLRESRRAQARLEENAVALRRLADSATDLVRVIDGESRLVYVSPSCERLLGYDQQTMLAMEPFELLHEDERAEARELGELVRSGQRSMVVFVHRLLHRSGEWRWFETTAGRVGGGAGDHVHLTSRDIHERREAERALALFTLELEESESRMRVLSSASFEGIVISQEGVVVDVNENFADWIGRDSSDLIGLDGRSFFPEEEVPRILRHVEQGETYQAHLLRSDGSTLPVEVRGRVTTLHGKSLRIAVLRDISERLAREAEARAHAEELRNLSLRDELTGLYNRRGFLEHAGQALKLVTRQRQSAALFFVDLDGLKTINDTLGHEAGDRAISAAARLLSRLFREADIVARLGGDEFAIFAPECSAGDAAKIRGRLDAALDAANRTHEEPFTLSASFGGAFHTPDAPADLTALMDAADRKMYEEKRKNGSRTTRTEPEKLG